MCRSLVSVGYDGALYDCDFNQMLGIPLRRARSRGAPHRRDLAHRPRLDGLPIAVGRSLLRLHGRRGLELRRRAGLTVSRGASGRRRGAEHAALRAARAVPRRGLR